MNPKQIDVTCPCCSTVLTVDVLTRTILRSAKSQEIDETGKPVLDEGRWEQARETVSGREGAGKDAFDAALSLEQNREEDLDVLFEKVKKKARGREAGDEEAPF